MKITVHLLVTHGYICERFVSWASWKAKMAWDPFEWAAAMKSHTIDWQQIYTVKACLRGCYRNIYVSDYTSQFLHESGHRWHLIWRSELINGHDTGPKTVEVINSYPSPPNGWCQELMMMMMSISILQEFCHFFYRWSLYKEAIYSPENMVLVT